VLEHFFPDQEVIHQRQEHFRDAAPRESDAEGAVETLDGVEFTHHFVDAPGDYETVRFHYVEKGDPANETILFLHAFPPRGSSGTTKYRPLLRAR